MFKLCGLSSSLNDVLSRRLCWFSSQSSRFFIYIVPSRLVSPSTFSGLISSHRQPRDLFPVSPSLLAYGTHMLYPCILLFSSGGNHPNSMPTPPLRPPRFSYLPTATPLSAFQTRSLEFSSLVIFSRTTFTLLRSYPLSSSIIFPILVYTVLQFVAQCSPSYTSIRHDISFLILHWIVWIVSGYAVFLFLLPSCVYTYLAEPSLDRTS
ncbi:hypothetical protein BJ165DRAFT_871114 [Panaeolus papilionaceus]|nr:hypothetical protein BJ165DRAFT_871114 [Panaeolus papilionaceus]